MKVYENIDNNTVSIPIIICYSLAFSVLFVITILCLSLPQYFILLFCIFLLEIIAGVMAYMNYQKVIFNWKMLYSQ